MYKHDFSCKINCTKVKQTATKLHKSPDETDKARSRSLLQIRDSDFTPPGGSVGFVIETREVVDLTPGRRRALLLRNNHGQVVHILMTLPVTQLLVPV